MTTRIGAALGDVWNQERGGPLLEIPLNGLEAAGEVVRGAVSLNSDVIVEQRRHVAHATTAAIGDAFGSLKDGKPFQFLGDAVLGVAGGLQKDAIDAVTAIPGESVIIRNTRDNASYALAT